MTAHGPRRTQLLKPPKNRGCNAVSFSRVCANASDVRKQVSPALERTTMPMQTTNGLWLPARRQQSHRAPRDRVRVFWGSLGRTARR